MLISFSPKKKTWSQNQDNFYVKIYAPDVNVSERADDNVRRTRCKFFAFSTLARLDRQKALKFNWSHWIFHKTIQLKIRCWPNNIKTTFSQEGRQQHQKTVSRLVVPPLCCAVGCLTACWMAGSLAGDGWLA